MNEAINKSEDLPAAVGETHGDGAEQQAALGLADDGLAVGPRRDHQELSQTVPVAARRGERPEARGSSVREDLTMRRTTTHHLTRQWAL